MKRDNRGRFMKEERVKSIQEKVASAITWFIVSIGAMLIGIGGAEVFRFIVAVLARG